MRYDNDMKLQVLSALSRGQYLSQSVDLYYVLKGSMTAVCSGKEIVLEKEQMIIVNLSVPFSYIRSENSLVILFSINKEFLFRLTGGCSMIFDSRVIEYHNSSYTELSRLLKETLLHHCNSGVLDKVREYKCYYACLWYLIRNLSNWDKSRDEESKTVDRLDQILIYIQNNYMKQLGLQDIADRFSLSVPYLSKYIKKNAGVGFVEYLSTVRLNHAVDEMTTTDHSMTQIAFDNGFPNMASFNRVFKQNYGMVPTAYKRKLTLEQKEAEPAVSELETKQILKEYFSENPYVESSRQQTVWVKADAQRKLPYVKNWNCVLNIGAVQDIKNSNVQNHIRFLKNSLDFQYGRIWSLFVKDNLVDIHSRDAFNFTEIDQVLDFMDQNHILPFIDLGLKPKRIVLNDLSTILMIDRDREFDNMQSYRRLISEFIQHCVDRFGIEKVEQWKFEVWWDRRGKSGVSSAYIDKGWLELFDTAYQCLKAYAPGAQVGAFGIAVFDNNSAVEHLLMDKASMMSEPDFLSITLYPYLKQTNGLNYNIAPDNDFIENELIALQAMFLKYGVSTDKLYITEYNQSISNRDFLNDTVYKGAYIVKNVIDSVSLTPCMGYWGSTDLINEYFDSISFLNGSSGLLSKDGICKPAFYALVFLDKLANNLLVKGKNYIVTETNHGSFFILCHNEAQFDMDYYLKSGEQMAPKEIAQYFHGNDLTLDIAIENAAAGKYRITEYYMNSDAGSVFDEWGRMGFQQNLDLEELNYLRNISIPHMRKHMAVVTDNMIRLDATLKLNEIRLIHIKQAIN
ncbi:GH39 family glycosyl hydrolase [Lachnoclostridium sp. Marseille-P6806]|uniref:GH39 family glycosyl hydrolase n=1 Tax=Lachnoclostridium sp. Marseille-P6806 TaxID=2364793 RepID=UPI0010307BCE|nr:helix-turn-helix domain-containing protein [Lachnoclostridium sp. Marseille-P6806]